MLLGCKCTSSPPASQKYHKLRPEVIHEGYVDRKGRTRFQGWTRRYAVLIKYPKKTMARYVMEFFKHPSSTNAESSFDLSKLGEDCEVSAVNHLKKKFCFVIRDKDHNMLASADGEIDRVKWMDALADSLGIAIEDEKEEESVGASAATAGGGGGRLRRTSSTTDHVPSRQRSKLNFGIFTFRIHIPSIDAIIIVTTRTTTEREMEDDETITLTPTRVGHGSSTATVEGERVPLEVYFLMKSLSVSTLKETLYEWLRRQLKTPQLIVSRSFSSAAAAAVEASSSPPSSSPSSTPATKRSSSSASAETTSFDTPSIDTPKKPGTLFSVASPAFGPPSVPGSANFEENSSSFTKLEDLPPAPLPRPRGLVDTKSGRSIAGTMGKLAIKEGEEKKRTTDDRLELAKSCLQIWWERSPKLDALRVLRSMLSGSKDSHAFQETTTMMPMLDESILFKQVWDMVGLVKDITLVSSAYASSRLRCEIMGTKTLLDMHSKKYTSYSMVCSSGELNWSIRRRFKEFDELHTKVKLWLKSHVKESVAEKLPQLPAKTFSISGKKMDNLFVSRRERALQRYVANLLALEWSTECMPILSFFGALSTSRHETYKKNAERSVVHASEIQSFAGPGDVLLFRTRSRLSALQRGVTFSQWDHVGMITCRDSSSKLWLLEACGEQVVCLPLVPRLKAYAKEYAECIALRRFEKPARSKGTLAKLAFFTEEVKGKPYSCTPAKLLRRKSVGDGIESTREDGYFCSELVAAALKRVGYLDRRMANSYFWPGSYKEGGDVEKHLKDGVVLGDLVIVDCKFAEIGRAVRDSSFG